MLSATTIRRRKKRIASRWPSGQRTAFVLGFPARDAQERRPVSGEQGPHRLPSLAAPNRRRPDRRVLLWVGRLPHLPAHDPRRPAAHRRRGARRRRAAARGPRPARLRRRRAGSVARARHLGGAPRGRALRARLGAGAPRQSAPPRDRGLHVRRDGALRAVEGRAVAHPRRRAPAVSPPRRSSCRPSAPRRSPAWPRGVDRSPRRLSADLPPARLLSRAARHHAGARALAAARLLRPSPPAARRRPTATSSSAATSTSRGPRSSIARRRSCSSSRAARSRSRRWRGLGMSGVVTGINAEGIFVCINAARTDDKGERRHARRDPGARDHGAGASRSTTSSRWSRRRR